MITKLLYVVVSSEKDVYLEQTYVSMFSAKRAMKDCHIALLIDSCTESTLTGNREKMAALADETVVVDLDASLSAHHRSRLLKTGARRHIAGDYLFIDTDTIIVQDLTEIDDITASIAACLDSHTYLTDNPYRRKILSNVASLGLDISDEKIYFNSGVVLVKDNKATHEFYDKWQRIYIEGLKQNVTMDQPSFHVANHEMDKMMAILPDTWNCELKHGTKFLDSAKIVHYLCTNVSKAGDRQVFLLNEKDVFDRIKQTGEIPQEVRQCIDNPLSGLNPITTLVAGLDTEILQSFGYQALKRLYSSPERFKRTEKLLQRFARLKKARRSSRGGEDDDSQQDSRPKWSIIIPHHNQPQLLERLLFSIPVRNDIEVIVVDDCSDAEHHEALSALTLQYPHCHFTSTETGGGGGKARNRGLEMAKGEFVIFADSDDYFLPRLNDILDKYKKADAETDIIFFNIISLDSSTGDPCDRWRHIDKYFKAYKKGDELQLRYLFGEPWGKIIRKEMIDRHAIRFDEVPINNDTTFSYLAGHHARKIAVENSRAYCLTFRTGSVSNTISWERLEVRLNVFIRKHLFLKENRIDVFDHMLVTPFWDCIKGRNMSKFKEFLNISARHDIPKRTILGYLLGFVGHLIRNKIEEHS